MGKVLLSPKKPASKIGYFRNDIWIKGFKNLDQQRQMSTLVDIDSIRFTHARVYARFSGCATLVEDTLAQMIDGRLSIEKLPMITVLQSDTDPQVYYSLNNRRLWVLKQLRNMDRFTHVAVRVRKMQPHENKKYTTERCMLEARLK